MQKYINQQIQAFTASKNSADGVQRSGKREYDAKHNLKSPSFFSLNLSDQLAPLLNEHLNSTPFIVYCIHSCYSMPNQSSFRGDTKEQQIKIRNSLDSTTGKVNQITSLQNSLDTIQNIKNISHSIKNNTTNNVQSIGSNFQRAMKGIPIYQSTLALRNSLIHPILIWQCFGFPDWIELGQFSRDFHSLLCQTRREAKSETMFFQMSPRQRAYAILICFAEPLHFMIGTSHVILKPGILSHLSSLIRQPKKAQTMRLQAFPGQSSAYLAAIRRQINSDFPRQYSPITCSWNPYYLNNNAQQEEGEVQNPVVQKSAVHMINSYLISQLRRKQSKLVYRATFQSLASNKSNGLYNLQESRKIQGNQTNRSQTKNSNSFVTLLPSAQNHQLNYLSGVITPTRTSRKSVSTRKSRTPPSRHSRIYSQHDQEYFAQQILKKGRMKSPYRWPCGCPSRSNLLSGSLNIDSPIDSQIQNIIKLNTKQQSQIQKIVRQATNVTPRRTMRPRIDYNYYLPDIIKIQSWVRGFLVRKRKKWLEFASFCSINIQKHWKGYRQRKFYLFYQLRKYAATAIQRKYRLHYNKRSKYAKVIQKWYLRHIEKKFLPLANKKLDQQLVQYQRLTSQVMGDLIVTQKAKRKAFINTLSPKSKKRRIQAMAVAGDVSGIQQQIKSQRKENKVIHSFKPQINDNSKKIVQKKRKQLEKSGRTLQKQMFKNTLQQSSGSTKVRSNLNNSIQRKINGKRAVTPEPFSDIKDCNNWKDVLSQRDDMKQNNRSSSTPGVRQDCLEGLDQESSEVDKLIFGDRLRKKLKEQNERQQLIKRQKSKNRQKNFEEFLARQQKMERKRIERQNNKDVRQSQKQIDECTWSPSINKSSKLISNRGYRALHSWQNKKQASLQEKRSSNIMQKQRECYDFKASKHSQKILKKAEKRITNQIAISSARKQCRKSQQNQLLTSKPKAIWPLKFERDQSFDEEMKNSLEIAAAESQMISSRRVFTEGNEEEENNKNEGSFLVMGVLNTSQADQISRGGELDQFNSFSKETMMNLSAIVPGKDIQKQN